MDKTNNKLDEFTYNVRRPVDCETEFPRGQNLEKVNSLTYASTYALTHAI